MFARVHATKGSGANGCFTAFIMIREPAMVCFEWHSRSFTKESEPSDIMQALCSKCRSIYRPASNDVLVCIGCGDQLPSPVATGLGGGRETIKEQLSVGENEASIASATVNPTAEEPSVTLAEVSGLLPVNPPKSPGLAALLSFLLVGMGQIYLGQVEKGLCMLGIVLLLIMSAVSGPLGLVILLLNVLDAFLLGRKVQQGQQIRKWQLFFQSK